MYIMRASLLLPLQHLNRAHLQQAVHLSSTRRLAASPEPAAVPQVLPALLL